MSETSKTLKRMKELVGAGSTDSCVQNHFLSHYLKPNKIDMVDDKSWTRRNFAILKTLNRNYIFFRKRSKL